ncbi:3-oxoacyl-ACP reductase FabG [Shewanella oneidensis MR-1]|uniref:3-oxoacyl-(Acyl-carrier-protein) reductase FabG n=1 Tax=Shewanella oneidensis (strain ATCC 700550 / JCM 31522 / CIP 106686 / LMG 19005 / NCIMB 14063 / MR-1) TaxID=211586 RepID=Q8E9A2_SHEON|nr:3-ketoacyl-ACP reductase FabG2 [Shewanella oneidensis]AAN57350.1 3-oxoacyl-(acyl-carrier-protein) reductase FabG [Shewanella oneidensis MR-1]MDX5998344.1 3-ketoacyl-ACP reductase FabG2 [Shewanella oneidensis]MEE2027120.1 3-oxoacyl-[acyl-carrier-protein] reductase FabG [Shewanella oneidensis]QKG94686.1 3-oxoacyl-ACP reductase FabG [Shewanella oneidensis MR-1]
MNNRVLVTGSSRGIGKAIALKLAAAGHDIALHYHSNQAAADASAAELRALGVNVSLLKFDVADRVAVRAALEADIEANGAYYGVVLNAGINRDNAFPAMSEAEWDSVIHTNLDGFYNVIHPCVMPMVQARKGGRIITLASVSGIAGNRGQVNYSASKAGLIGATKALSLELAKRKITVNCIAPGLIETDMVADIPKDMVEQLVPMRRMGKPNEIAALAAFLMSDDAAYITRQVISVNGGMI